MSFALWPKSIHCPNCHYEGSAKVKGTGGSLGIMALIFIVLGFIIHWAMFVLGLIFMVLAVFKPADQICPTCKFANPVPLDNWRAQQASRGNR